MTPPEGPFGARDVVPRLELRREGETGHSAATGHDHARPDLYPPDPVQGPAVPDDPG